MLVTVTTPTNTATYSFDPQHKAEVIGYYTKLYWQGYVRKFTATMDDGSIVAIGA